MIASPHSATMRSGVPKHTDRKEAGRIVSHGRAPGRGDLAPFFWYDDGPS